MIAVDEDLGRLLATLRLFGKTANPLLPFRGQGLAIAKMLTAPRTNSGAAYIKTVPVGRHHARIIKLGGATIVDAGVLVNAGVTSIVSKDADVMTIDTYDVPAEVQALTGYGLSVGSLYNYIDFERKVFVRRVGGTDLGTLSWYDAPSSQGDAIASTSLIGVIKPPPNSATPGNVINPRYAISTSNNVYNPSLAIGTAGHVYLRDLSYATTTELKASLNGVYMNYELATPIETDISAYLTDDAALDVVGGGTLTFENSNSIPVPSTVVFAV